MTADPAPAPLTLSEPEAAAVAQAAGAFADALPAERDRPYRDLVGSARAGAVPAGQLPILERVCGLALQTGKAREIGRAEAERLLMAVLRRTPSGRASSEECAAVNRALAEFAGRRLSGASITWRMPGRYYLNLSVEGLALVLSIEPDGVHVQSLHAG